MTARHGLSVGISHARVLSPPPASFPVKLIAASRGKRREKTGLAVKVRWEIPARRMMIERVIYSTIVRVDNVILKATITRNQVIMQCEVELKEMSVPVFHCLLVKVE